MGEGGNGVVDDKFPNAEARREGVEFAAHPVGRADDDARRFLFDAVVGDGGLPRELFKTARY